MRDPWAIHTEHDEVARQREDGQMERLKACNAEYVDRIQELRFIMSRLAGEKAEIEKQYNDILVVDSVLSHAVIYMMDFIDEMEDPLWDLLGTDGLKMLKENVFVIERISE